MRTPAAVDNLACAQRRCGHFVNGVPEFLGYLGAVHRLDTELHALLHDGDNVFEFQS
jgi:hypothetical protein